MKEFMFEVTYRTRDNVAINEAKTVRALTTASAWRKATAWANRDLPGSWLVLSLTLIGKEA